MKSEKLKLLITSIGSLIGSNLLDVLEYQPFRRREMVHLIGTTSVADEPNNFRCDRCYLVPETASDGFLCRLASVIGEEAPDLILHGRDADTKAVAQLLDSRSNLSIRPPCGSSKAACYALNKWQTWQFALRHNLPFAESFVVGKSGDLSELDDFTRRVGFPMIAKPIEGFASRGVYFVRNLDETRMLATFENYIFQEYLGQRQLLEEYFESMQMAIPLFASAPNIYHHSCSTVISPQGKIANVFVSKNDHVAGVTMGFRKVEHRELEEIATRYAHAMYEEGGYGPFSIQFRQDKGGAWKAQEVNLRANGNTFPRFLMGQDDLGLLVNDMFPEFDFPVYNPPQEASGYLIRKSPHCYIVRQDDLHRLEADKVWQ